KTENCDKYQNCETCSSSGDPFCGWCTLKNKCSTKESCQNDENFVQDSSKCVKILSLTPKLAPVEMDLLEISIHFNHLPLLAPNQKFRCQLGFDEKPSFIEDAIIAEKNILRCTKKAYKRQNWTNNGNVQTILPLKVKIDDHYVLKESNFTFFDCSSFGLCTGCISTEFPCNWCISDNKCRYKNEKCDHDEQKYSNPAWQCPRMEVDRSIMVTDSFPVSIRMNVLNMEKLTNMDLDKLFCVTTIESKDIVVDAILSHDKRNVSCEEYTYFYTSKKPTVVANLTLKTVAGLSIDQMHVYKCEMMADDCTQCLAVDPIFRCGWCDNKCRYVLGFEPKSGPVQGGTLIQIEGRDLRSQDRVWIGGIPCHVTGYHSSGGLSCLTGHSDEPSSAPLKVERSPQVSGHSKEYFHFIEPALEAFQPNVGPKSGGTKVVLSGRHLTSATNVSASFGNLPCRIDRVISSPSALVCYTSPANGSFEQYDTLLLRLDNANLTLKVPFTYMPDPVVITINPLAALQSGGRKISIIGQSFQSIQKPLMYLLDEQGRTASESSICQVVNSTLMLCPSPSLIPRIVENPKVKRQIEIDHSQLQKYKNYGVGFKMDDVTGINDLGSIFRFTITPDPVVDHFKGDKISRPSDPLVLEGRHLRIGSSPDDYAITIGDQPCNISYLADSQLICQPTMVDSTGETDPDDMTSTAQRIVIVKIGNTIYRPGILTYNSLIATGLRNSMLEVSGPEGQSRPVQVVQGVDGALVGCILGACSAFVLILLATFGVWWKRKNWAVERDYRRIQLQMDMLESNVRQECKQAFAELQTDMSDLTGDLVPLNIPYWPLDRYAVKILFREDQRNALQILDHRYHNNGYSNPLTTSFKHFDSLLGNQNFVSTLIECLEKQNSINSYDKSYIGSLLTIILAQNMEYFTDILFSLLKKLIAKTVQEKNPQLMLRRSDTIVEKLLTNWMAICCYDYLQQTPGQSLFLLFKALKHQIEKGPVDAVTSEARYTLSEESLLKQALLRVVPPNNDYAGGQTILCRVLNCDTIGQVKSKILDTLYRNLAFTMRPSVNDIDLEWRGNGSIQSITLTDKPDTSTPPCPGTPTKQSSSSHLTIQRLNTVASYRLPDHAVIYVLPKIRDCPVYTSSGDSTHTYASINSSTLLLSKTNRQMVTFNSILAQNRDLVVESRNNSLDSSTSSSGIGTAATNPSLRNSWQSTNGGSSRKAGKKHSTLNSRTSASASNGGTMTKFWHLVKPDEAKEPGAIRHGSIPEIYLTRLLATKGTVQHFIDDFVLCALNVGPDFPPAVKYLFDFFHSEASRHNLSDISIINSWKTNSIALRFWVNTIKNPDFVFDVEKTAALDSCLSVVAQTFMDACSSGGGANGPFSNQYQNSQKLNKDSPSSKLLFARDVGKYQQNFRHYYCDVQNKVQTVSDEKLKLIMRSLSENFANLGVDSAIHELLAYVSRYRE
uniref:Uncharacterized protein n=1 Tax=Romanomermis culicivorax TaxID=13658 RepID=A0A915K3C8_ROMCU